MQPEHGTLSLITSNQNQRNLNPLALAMYERMNEVAREKYAGYTVHLIDRWPALSTITVDCIIGSMVITSTSTKQRWLLARDAIPFGDTWVTSADLARIYLNLKYKGVKRRITTPQWKDFYETNRYPPLAALPLSLENAYYVDIRSAYWTILRAVGWDVDYMPDHWLKVKDRCTVNDFPFPQIKMARNCLVSLAADGSRQIRCWDGQKMYFRRGGNALVNKMLWSLVCDVLNNVAYECLQVGAVYSFTDGFIVPEESIHDVEEVISSWGFGTSIKASGVTEIKGAGAYRIGNFITRKFKKQSGTRISKIRPRCLDWLKPRFAFFARRNQAVGEWDYDAYVRSQGHVIGSKSLD